MPSAFNGIMAKKPKTTGKPAGGRKPFKQARIRLPIAELAEQRAKTLIQDFNQYVNDAVRMRLEAEGAWPPAPPRKP